MADSAVVLLVDDDARIRRTVGAGLRLEGFEVVPASGGRAALAAVEQIEPAVMLLDMAMPDLDGLEVLKRLRGAGHDLPVCVLSARDEIGDRVAGLEAGADDYVVKPFAPRELLARIRAALRRLEAADAEVVTAGTLKLDSASHQVSAGGAEVALGPTEYRLLEFFMRHSDRVYSRAQLLDRVWGGNVYVEERTVDVHIRRLRMALAPTGHDSFIRTVRGAGYRFSVGTS